MALLTFDVRQNKMEIHDPRFLAEVDRVFSPDGVHDSENDAGWNCYAKAFVSTWLYRIWGQESQVCEGRLCIVTPDSGQKFIRNVSPHAWTGVGEKKIVDISMRDLEGYPYLTVIGGHIAESGCEWGVFFERDIRRFERLVTGAFENAPERFLAYSPREIRQFSPEEIQSVGATCSPSVARTLSRYPENLLPKAILHLYLFAEGQKESLAENGLHALWDELHGWHIDAYRELISLLE